LFSLILQTHVPGFDWSCFGFEKHRWRPIHAAFYAAFHASGHASGLLLPTAVCGNSGTYYCDVTAIIGNSSSLCLCGFRYSGLKS
jgi:hypothetical protein